MYLVDRRLMESWVGGGGLGGLDLLSVDMVRCSASEGMAEEALDLPGALG